MDLQGNNIMRAELGIRRLDDNSEVHRVELRSTNSRYVDKVMSGLLRNMDTSIYYVDDSETDQELRECLDDGLARK